MSDQESQAKPASNGTGQSQSRPPTCYNCGANDHFMMACPEPTRTMPAGLEAARAAQAAQAASGKGTHSQTPHPKSQKRHKSYGGPVVTRYPAPRSGPVVIRFGVSPIPYGAPQAYPQYGAYAQPQAQPYYQGPPPSQSSYGQYIQHSHPQAVQPSTQPYGPTPVPAAATYGPPAPNVYVSQGPPTPQYQHNYQQPYGTTGPEYSPQQHGTYPSANNPPYRQPGVPYVPPANAYPYPAQLPYPNHAPNQGGPKHQQTPSYPLQPQGPSNQQGLPSTGHISPNTQCPPPQSFQASPTQPLPAIQTSRSFTNNEDIEFDWLLQRVFRKPKLRPADPIRTPLPATFDNGIILPPPYDSPYVISKYAKADNFEEFCKTVRNTEAWTEMQYDPAFKDIDRSAPFIPLEDIHVWTEKRYRIMYQDGDCGFDRHAPSASRKRASSEDHMQERPRKRRTDEDNEDTHTSIPNPVGPTNANADSAMTFSLRRSTTSAVEDSRSSHHHIENNVWASEPGETALATPTVDTQEAHPVSLGIGQTQTPIEQKPSDINSTNFPDTQMLQDRQKTCRQDSGYDSARGSYSNGGGPGRDQARDHEDNRSRKHNYQAAPPPPRPPAGFSRQTDGSLDSPVSSNSSHEASRQQDFEDPDTSQKYLDDGMSSPLSPTSAELLGFGQPSSHSNSRQGRNQNLRNRRRQPRVADAYSRRW